MLLRVSVSPGSESGAMGPVQLGGGGGGKVHFTLNSNHPDRSEPRAAESDHERRALGVLPAARRGRLCFHESDPQCVER